MKPHEVCDMALNNSVVLFDVDTSVKYKDKLEWKNKVLKNGGCVSYSLNSKVCLSTRYSFVISFLKMNLFPLDYQDSETLILTASGDIHCLKQPSANKRRISREYCKKAWDSNS